MSQTYNEVAKKSDLKQPYQLLTMENKEGDNFVLLWASHTIPGGDTLLIKEAIKKQKSPKEEVEGYRNSCQWRQIWTKWRWLSKRQLT